MTGDRPATLRALPWIRWCLVGTLLLLVSGCSGCRPQATAKKKQDAAKKAEAEKPKEEIESRELRVLPTDENLAAYGIKPGHWISVRHELKANRADFKGELSLASTDRNFRTSTLVSSPYRLLSVRPAVLPKGQTKNFELTGYPPARIDGGNQVYLQSELRTEYGGAVRHMKSQVTNRMRPHQAFLVVLSRRPDSYAYVKTLESIRPTTTSGAIVDLVPDYITVIPQSNRNLPLPSWSPMWSNIAYLLWDEIDPKTLTRDQQQAMLEWLHWGGQLIVSGPGSLDTLGNSFLAPYLPTRGGPIRPMTRQDATALDARWSVPSADATKDPNFPWTDATSMEVLQWELLPGGNAVDGTGQLVVERRVGRGRIVVTAFSLTARPWITWRSVDNFFNGCLLRRPGRRFDYSLESGHTSQWTNDVARLLSVAVDPLREPLRDSSPDSPEETLIYESLAARSPQESLLNSGLRYFARDAAALGAATELGPTDRRWDVLGYQTDARAGVAGWNDESECSQRARNALTTAAGISIPDAGFVLSCLGVYLFVLVPANWAIFRAIGRVEWAWLAVPVLAMIGTVTVVRLARLDIGFARSLTEIAVVEMQPEFSRAHVTRYTGLYTALTTQYDVVFDQDSALALPMSHRTADAFDPSRSSALDIVLKRRDRRGENVVLESFAVSSNSTGMIRSEQILDLNGPILYQVRSDGAADVTNRSSLEIEDAGVLRRTANGRLEFAWIGRLASQATSNGRFQSLSEKAPTEAWTAFQSTVSPSGDQLLQLRPLLELAANPRRLQPGTSCLIGWFATELPGMEVRPSTNQRTSRGLLIAHLQYGALPAPASDENAPSPKRFETEND
jgi:hypothetical protein